MLVNSGVDKWKDGLMYSLLCCDAVNSSAVRRTPFAYADSPAIESTYNLEELLAPIYDQLSLIKDNSSILQIKIKDKHHCAILHCSAENKINMDRWWRSQTGTRLWDQPESMHDSETHKRKCNWNLINHGIDKIFILNDITNIQVLNSSYPDIFICCTIREYVSEIHIIQKTNQSSNVMVGGKVIGSGIFWGEGFASQKN